MEHAGLHCPGPYSHPPVGRDNAAHGAPRQGTDLQGVSLKSTGQSKCPCSHPSGTQRTAALTCCYLLDGYAVLK